MKTRAELHKLMVAYYLKPKSAKRAAEEIRARLYLPPSSETVTTEAVLAAWRQEFNHQPIWQALERQEGERPLHGYPPGPMIELCMSLAPVAEAA